MVMILECGSELPLFSYALLDQGTAKAAVYRRTPKKMGKTSNFGWIPRAATPKLAFSVIC